MRVVLFCEGKTEAALRQGLHDFVRRSLLAKASLGIETRSLDGPVFRNKLPRLADRQGKQPGVVGIVALTDVYPTFASADHAKRQLEALTKGCAYRDMFRAHAAQYELEAWLLPAWGDIARSLRQDVQPPGAKPEEVNSDRPPSHHLKELFRRAGRRYNKVLEGPKWLTADRLESAAERCPELKSFLDSLLAFGRLEHPA